MPSFYCKTGNKPGQAESTERLGDAKRAERVRVNLCTFTHGQKDFGPKHSILER